MRKQLEQEQVTGAGTGKKVSLPFFCSRYKFPLQVPVISYLLLVPVLLVILGVVTPTAVLAGAGGERPVPTGEATYDQAYVPCGQFDKTGPQGKPDGIVDNPCQFTDVIAIAKRIIAGWIGAGVIFATMGFAYAGLLYITAMGSAEKISHAHGIFIKTFWGFVFMLSAWLIAYAMQNIFLTERAKQGSFLLDTTNGN